MTERKSTDDLQAELKALAEVFEAEEREDRRADGQRRRRGMPEPKRGDILTYEGFANGGAAARPNAR